VSPTHADFQTGVTSDGPGKNYDWIRTGNARGMPACLALRCNRVRSLQHGWVLEPPFPRRCHGDPILTTGAGKPRRIPGTGLWVYLSGERTMTLPVPATCVSFGKEPRTRMNDDPVPALSRTSSHSREQETAIPPVIIHSSLSFFLECLQEP
jgi:hypothetical protein